MLANFKKIFCERILGQRPNLGHGTERQIATNLLGIRVDHKARYRFASMKLSGLNILDAASGIGYGSFILAKDNKDRKIWAVDKDEPAHYFGKAHYDHKNILRIPLFLEDISKLDKEFDGCTCFETLEHLQDPNLFLAQLRTLVKPGGKLFASSPNELVMPFHPKKFRHHVRHFTPLDLTNYLRVQDGKFCRDAVNWINMQALYVIMQMGLIFFGSVKHELEFR